MKSVTIGLGRASATATAGDRRERTANNRKMDRSHGYCHGRDRTAGLTLEYQVVSACLERGKVDARHLQLPIDHGEGRDEDRRGVGVHIDETVLSVRP